MNKFNELKWDRFIKKIRSNAIAILTNQIEIHSGYFKMNYLLGRIEDIKLLEEIDLSILKTYYNEIQSHPIGDERKLYSEEFLGKLDLGLKRIDERYLDDLTEKCGEIIEKFKDIKDFC